MDLQTRLKEARNALHQLMIGRSVVEVTDQNGEKLRYTAANRTDLKQYVAELEAELAACQNGGDYSHLGPMRVWGARG